MNLWSWRRGVHDAKVDETHSEAKAAFANALEARQRAEEVAAQVEPVMDKIRERRRVNGFTELFEQALKGGKPNES